MSPSLHKIMPVPPLLAEGKLDYGSYRYTPEVALEGDKVEVSHEQLDGANLVHELVAQGKAQYACEIISPSTAYRKLFCLPVNGGDKQVLDIPDGEVARTRIYARPLVISNCEGEFVGAEKHGLHHLLVGRKFLLQKGTIIADGGYYVIERAIGHIFYLRKDKDLKDKGAYSLEIEREEGEGFYFRIRMNPALYDSFKGTSFAVKRMFLVSNFATALEYIDRCRREEHGGDGESLLEVWPNLKHLFTQLEAKCCNDQEDIFEKINAYGAALIASKFFPLEMLPEHED